MLDNDVFVIDLTGCVRTGEIINSISLALEIPSACGKKISLKFKDMVLNQTQLMSIKSLISSHNSTLDSVETTNEEMKKNCESLGVFVNFISDIKIDENKIVIEEFKSPSAEDLYKKSENEIETEFEFDKELKKEPEEFYQAKEEEIRQEFDYGEYKTPTPEEFYQNSENEIKYEEEVRESDLPNGDINIEEAIHQSARVAFENATNLDFMKEIIKESEKNEEDMQAYTKAEVEDDGEEKIDYFTPPTDEPVVVDSTQTIYVSQTLRSGQVLEYDGNIVIIGDCHPGSEVKATGDITVWGVLGSIAHAGIKGDRNAKIRALKMNAVQLRIADCYSRRPDGSNIPYIIKSATFTPEEARIVDDGIVLHKMN